MILAPAFIGAILVGGGVWGLYMFGQYWRQSNVQDQWAIAPGKITRSELQRISPRQEPDSIAMFGVNIIYIYTVAGKNYRGEVTDNDIGVINKIRGDQLMAEFQKNDEVPIYYNPHRPFISTLFPQADVRLYRRLLFSLLAIGGGVFMLALSGVL